MSKTFAIGDLHGRYDLFQKVEQFLKLFYPEGGKLVILGDMIDRGPQSRQLIERLIRGPENDKWEWVTLMGNHEAMMLSGLGDMLDGGRQGVYKWWLSHGGETTIASYGGRAKIPDEHIQWLLALPQYHTDDHRLYVHAGVNPDKPLNEQVEDTLLWIFHKDDMTKGCEHYHVVHGHKDKLHPLCLEGRTGLDVGAYKRGWIALAEFNDDEEGGPYRIHKIQ